MHKQLKNPIIIFTAKNMRKNLEYHDEMSKVKYNNPVRNYLGDGGIRHTVSLVEFKTGNGEVVPKDAKYAKQYFEG